MKKLLFACRHNTHRSKALKEIFGRALNERGYEAEIKTAGIVPADDNTPSPNLQAVMEARGYAPISGLAIKLTRQMVDEADLIITTTPEQYGTVLDNFYPSLSKIDTLSNLAIGREDPIDEPSKKVINTLKPEQNYAEYIEVAKRAASIKSNWRRTLYLAFAANGMVDIRDGNRVRALFEDMVSKMERYSVSAVDKLGREGFFE